jgi:16S rRNA (guanine527-N7)-methyltransferase
LPSGLENDRAKALALTPVSRETMERLDRFVALLLQWQQTTNLIAPSTVPHVWTRHIADSLQLLDFTRADLAPVARLWVDLGSGAGFPGLVLACALADRPGVAVHLVESNAKKAAFLREAARVTGAPAVVHGVRIEKLTESFEGRAEIITARALAPLDGLLGHCFGLWTPGTQALLHKGQDVDAELTEATRYWNMQAELVPSRTDPKARIVIIRVLQRRVVAQDGASDSRVPRSR